MCCREKAGRGAPYLKSHVPLHCTETLSHVKTHAWEDAIAFILDARIFGGKLEKAGEKLQLAIHVLASVAIFVHELPWTEIANIRASLSAGFQASFERCGELELTLGGGLTTRSGDGDGVEVGCAISCSGAPRLSEAAVSKFSRKFLWACCL